jgi:hypothetical protein
MPFGIMLYDDDRRIVAIDEAAAVAFGKPPQELVSRLLTEFVPQPDRAELAEMRATFERIGEASGHYALEREDGSRESIVYRVLANAPLPGLNLMAIARSDAEVASDLARVRRIGDDVHAGLDASEDERWFGSGPRRMHSSTKSSEATKGGAIIAAVFPTEEDAWAALLVAQPRVGARVQIALSSFDGGWPRDQRSVLVARDPDDHFKEIAAVVAEFGGTLMAGKRQRLR